MTSFSRCTLLTFQTPGAESMTSPSEEFRMRGPCAPGSLNSGRIDGDLSTNVGSIWAVRFGMARDLILGLEVVLP